MAKSDDISRLRRKKKRLRAKYKKQQRVIRGLDKANARWIHDARQEGVARLRAEDQLDDERSEYRTYREQTHRQMLAIMPAARPLAIMPADLEANQPLAIEAAPAAHALALAPAAGPKKSKRRGRSRRSPSPSPSSSSDDSSSSSSSSSDGASRKRRRHRSRSMSAEALEKRARRNEMIATDREGRIVMARYQTATSQARRRKAGRQLDRERDRALSRLEFESD